MDSFTLFFSSFFSMRHKLLCNVWCRRRPSGSLSLRVSVVFKVIPHIHPVLFFSHIYILLLISYNSYKKGVVSWMVSFFATEIWDLRLMERCSLRSMLTMRILPKCLGKRNWNMMLWESRSRKVWPVGFSVSRIVKNNFGVSRCGARVCYFCSRKKTLR